MSQLRGAAPHCDETYNEDDKICHALAKVTMKDESLLPSETLFQKLFKLCLMNDEGRQQMLERFHLSEPELCSEAMSRYSEGSILHIGSGSYANVFRQTFSQGGPAKIFKVVRLLPEEFVDRIENSNVSRTTQYAEAHNEYVISWTLSRLNHAMIHANQTYICHMFPIVYEGFLIEGLPSHCFKAEVKIVEEENEHSGSPKATSGFAMQDTFEEYFLDLPVESLVMVMEDCGEPISDVLEQLSPYAILSVVKQVIVGMTIAEMVYEFEHRDLHSGNVLLQPTQSSHIQYMVRGKKLTVPSYGYQVKIIDTTFSRIRINQRIYHKDLSYLFDKSEAEVSEEEATARQVRMQDVTYQAMSREVGENWASFHPRTNLHWTRYIIYKLLKSSHFTKCSVESEPSGPLPQLALNTTRKAIKGKGPVKQMMPTSHWSSSSSSCSENQARQVYAVLQRYRRLMQEPSCYSAQTVFHRILREPALNDIVKLAYK